MKWQHVEPIIPVGGWLTLWLTTVHTVEQELFPVNFGDLSVAAAQFI